MAAYSSSWDDPIIEQLSYEAAKTSVPVARPNRWSDENSNASALRADPSLDRYGHWLDTAHHVLVDGNVTSSEWLERLSRVHRSVHQIDTRGCILKRCPLLLFMEKVSLGDDGDDCEGDTRKRKRASATERVEEHLVRQASGLLRIRSFATATKEDAARAPQPSCSRGAGSHFGDSRIGYRFPFNLDTRCHPSANECAFDGSFDVPPGSRKEAERGYGNDFMLSTISQSRPPKYVKRTCPRARHSYRTLRRVHPEYHARQDVASNSGTSLSQNGSKRIRRLPIANRRMMQSKSGRNSSFGKRDRGRPFFRPANHLHGQRCRRGCRHQERKRVDATPNQPLLHVEDDICANDHKLPSSVLRESECDGMEDWGDILDDGCHDIPSLPQVVPFRPPLVPPQPFLLKAEPKHEANGSAS